MKTAEEMYAKKLYNWFDLHIEGDITLKDCYAIIEFMRNKLTTK